MAQQVFSVKNGQSSEITYKIAKSGDKSIVVSVSRPKGKREALLCTGNELWLQSEKMKNPIKVSPAERLCGEAANADLLMARLKRDYDAQDFSRDGGEQKRILVLKPRNGGMAIYGRIELEVGRGERIDEGLFYAKSGKLIKMVTYEYSGERLKSLIIQDAIQKNLRTKVNFKSFKEKKFEKIF